MSVLSLGALRGARQTGKSSAVREFGSRFELFLELNLERYEDLTLVGAWRSADDLQNALCARHQRSRLALVSPQPSG